MTTLAHQGRNTTFLDACSAGIKTTHSEVRFSKIKGVNDVVSTTPECFASISLIVSRGLS